MSRIYLSLHVALYDIPSLSVSIIRVEMITLEGLTSYYLPIQLRLFIWEGPWLWPIWVALIQNFRCQFITGKGTGTILKYFPSQIAPTKEKGHNNLNEDIGLKDDARQKTSRSASKEDTSTVTIRALILIGFILLFVNVCACAGVIYQKYMLRHHQSRLREEVQVITELLVSKEQPQLALHVANVMKPANLEDKKAHKNTTTRTDKVST